MNMSLYSCLSVFISPADDPSTLHPMTFRLDSSHPFDNELNKCLRKLINVMLTCDANDNNAP